MKISEHMDAIWQLQQCLRTKRLVIQYPTKCTPYIHPSSICSKKKKDQNIVQVGTTHDSPPAGPGLPVLRFHETTELKPTKFNKPNFTIFFSHEVFRSLASFCHLAFLGWLLSQLVSKFWSMRYKLYINSSRSSALQDDWEKQKISLLTWLSTS